MAAWAWSQAVQSGVRPWPADVRDLRASYLARGATIPRWGQHGVVSRPRISSGEVWESHTAVCWGEMVRVGSSFATCTLLRAHIKHPGNPLGKIGKYGVLILLNFQQPHSWPKGPNQVCWVRN